MDVDKLALQRQTSKGKSPLHMACNDKNFPLVEYLNQQSDLKVNLRDRDGKTPLHRACRNSNEKVVELLLQHPEIDVNGRDKDGETPMHLALKTDILHIVQLLLEHKCFSINGTNKRKETPLDTIKSNIKVQEEHGSVYMQERLQTLKDMKKLFEENLIKGR